MAESKPSSAAAYGDVSSGGRRIKARTEPTSVLSMQDSPNCFLFNLRFWLSSSTSFPIDRCVINFSSASITIPCFLN